MPAQTVLRFVLRDRLYIPTKFVLGGSSKSLESPVEQDPKDILEKIFLNLRFQTPEGSQYAPYKWTIHFDQAFPRLGFPRDCLGNKIPRFHSVTGENSG